MNKTDYLKLAVQYKLYTKKAWMLTAFAVTKPSEIKIGYPGQLFPQPWGYAFLDEQLNAVKIDGTNSLEPLFSFKDRLVIDSTWAVNASDKIETTVGNLLFNLIVITSAFGSKFPYVTGTVKIKDLESKIAAKLQDTPEIESEKSTEYFYVDEYLKFTEALQYYSTLSQLGSWAATRKTILPPPGIEDFKAKLAVKYGDTLTNPVELAKYETELKDFDTEYLKGDPAFGTFVEGKIKDTARKKLYLNIGSESGFKDSMTVLPITNSLYDGWPSDPEQFTSMMNGTRSGSYSRGAETVNGGVSAKYLLRAANNFTIEDTDCGTKLGISRLFTSDMVDKLVGRYVIQGAKLVYVENKNIAANYLNQALMVRSPMYCKLQGDKICKVCAGRQMSQYPTGISIALTEISAMIITASLKKMHANNLATAKLDIKKALT